MFKLVNRYKKGVSPVIAVVLLIALTVAAAAVIWTLTSGILEGATGDSLKVKSGSGAITNSSGTLTVTYLFTASTAMTINSATVTTSANSTSVSYTYSFDTTSLTSGDNTVKLTITASDTAHFTAGAYKIDIKWTVSGESAQITQTTIQAS